MENEDYLQKLDALNKRLDKQQRRTQDDNMHDKIVEILKQVANVVRIADAQNAPALSTVVEKAGNILDGAIDWAYGDGDFDFLVVDRVLSEFIS